MKILFRPTKEMVLIVAMAVFPVIIFGFIATERSFKNSRIAAEEESKIIVTSFVGQIRSYLERSQDIIKSLAGLTFEKIDENNLKAVYENNSFQNLPLFESLSVVDEKGTVRVVYPFKKELLGLDYSRRPFFDFISREKKIYFSRVEFSMVTEQPVITIAVPIFKEEQGDVLAGVFEASIRLQALSFLVEEFGLERETGKVFLVDAFGKIIAHPNYQLVREQENIANVYPQLAAVLREFEEEGTFQYRDPRGIEYLVDFQTFFPTDWKLIAQQEVKEVLASAYQLFYFLVIILTMTSLGAGAIGYRIASYIKHLARGREKVIKERLKTLEEAKIVSERHKAELEEARSVLEIKVQARTRELKDLAEGLEEQVEQRTKELQEKMKELEKFNKLAVGRELKMIELKEEIEKLKEELEKYKGRQ